MKIAHEDVSRIPAPDLAVLVALGWVKEWPCELVGGARQTLKRRGYIAMMAEARDAVVACGGPEKRHGEITERT